MREVLIIPGDDHLLRRYHLRPNRNHLINGNLSPAIFYDENGELEPEVSVYAEGLMEDPREWCEPGIPGKMSIAAVLAGEARYPPATVEHAPNIPGFVVPYSHTHICGLTPAGCIRLVSMCSKRDVEPSPFTPR